MSLVMNDLRGTRLLGRGQRSCAERREGGGWLMQEQGVQGDEDFSTLLM